MSMKFYKARRFDELQFVFFKMFQEDVGDDIQDFVRFIFEKNNTWIFWWLNLI